MIDLDLTPDPSWLPAKQRLEEEYLTVSGRSVERDISSYFEMYRDTFLDELEKCGIRTDLQLARVLTQMNVNSNVGDFLDTRDDQKIELSGFGLILLDRMAAIRWGKDDPMACFVLHEQLFECFEYVMDAMKRRATARRAVSARHASTIPAKQFVETEWAVNRGAYGENKSAFARDYVRRIKREFNVDVTEKQLREVWLKGTPSTGSRGDLPVDG